jgi:DNA-binding response OmpR family regulator
VVYLVHMTKKILIIEDDNTLRGLLVQKMKGELFDVADAGDAFDVYKKLDAHVFDGVVLDLMLPEIDGYEILRKIRAHATNNKTKVLVFSNLADEARIDKALTLGANRYLVKTNVTLEELAEHLKEMIGE